MHTHKCFNPYMDVPTVFSSVLVWVGGWPERLQPQHETQMVIVKYITAHVWAYRLRLTISFPTCQILELFNFWANCSTFQLFCGSQLVDPEVAKLNSRAQKIFNVEHLANNRLKS